MELRLFETITDISQEEWDRIVPPDRIICSHSFLQAVEYSSINDCVFYYPVIYEKKRIVAHCCVYFISSEVDTFARGQLKRLITAVRMRLPRFMIWKTLECGTPVATGNTVCFHEGINRKQALSLIESEIARVAAMHGVRGLVFRDFCENELSFFDIFLSRGYRRVRNIPSAKLTVQWGSYDEYLQSLRHSYRRRIKQQKLKFEEGGGSIRLEVHFSHLAVELHRLWHNVYSSAKEYRREQLTVDFFRNVDSFLLERSVVLLAERDGRLVGFALLLLDTHTLWWLFCGLDYECSRQYNIYFNLLSEIIRIAIQERKSLIEMGVTTLEAKKNVGAIVEPLYVYMQHTNPIWNFFVPRLFEFFTPGDCTPERRVFKEQPDA